MARTATAQQATTRPNTSASRREILPRGIGRRAVRDITESMSASYHILRTPAAPAPAAIARIATSPSSGSSRLGAVSIPTNAVKTASAITRGFISAIKEGKRDAKLDGVARGEFETWIAVVIMITFTRADHGHAVSKLSVTWVLTRIALERGRAGPRAERGPARR